MSALTDPDLARLQSLLEALPAPLEPFDLSALDGFLCAVLLQPQPVPRDEWVAHVADAEGRRPPPAVALDELHALAERRHAELNTAIHTRQWFDPWIADLGDEASPGDSALPWVAGFAAGAERFGALMAIDDPALIEPLAMLYLHFDPADLEDADALLEVIERLEPPRTLAEAAEDIVRAVLLMADVSRPRAEPRRPARHRPARRGGAGPRR